MTERTRVQPPRTAAPKAPTEQHTNPVLWLQREAGNAAVAQLLQRESETDEAPAAPGAKKVDHVSGKKVDKYLLANSLVKAYVKPKMAGGIKAESAVKIEGAADFAAAWVAYAPGRDHPKLHVPFTRESAIAYEPNVNAFQDAGVIHIHESQGDPGTSIHETLHLFSDTAFIDLVGYDFNEGTTDFFTHLVAGEHHIPRTYNFPRQTFVIDRLARTSTKEKLAAAYFKNDIAGLKADVEKKSGAGAWDKLLGYMQAGDFPEATKLVK